MRYTGTNTTIITNVTCPIPRHNALTNKGPLKIEVSYFADYYGDFGITPNCRVIAYNRYGDVEIMRKTKNVPGLGRRVISLGKLPAAASKGKIVVDCSLGGNSRYGDFIGSILVTEEDS
ncbi:hypothetical protein GCM10025791_19530 [Halioxenophilus aromaticivorans]|uniref:Uncharacterized protein n=2 Tax=Halioxenophilus aromaticivorans TaxID=1306992 RepID=A0AAV3U1Z6_9ALTE